MLDDGELQGFLGPLMSYGVSPHYDPKARRNPTSPERSEGMIMNLLVNSGVHQNFAPLMFVILKPNESNAFLIFDKSSLP
jgi:hypothetical protein